MGNFNLKDLNALAQEMYREEKFYVDVENDKYITYFPAFPEKKINELLLDLFETIKYCDEKKIKDFDDNDYVNKYISFLIFKHLSSAFINQVLSFFSKHSKYIKQFCVLSNLSDDSRLSNKQIYETFTNFKNNL